MSEPPISITIAFYGLAAIVVLALATWTVSVIKRNVSIVDSMWAMFILAAGCVYAALLPVPGSRTPWVLGLVALWAARLAVYVTWRNWNEGEDRRYRAIRERNQPHFALKSVYLVFGLQSVLAWLVSLPLLAAFASPRAPTPLDLVGAAIVVFGIGYETIADLQLARFKASPQSHGRVLDHGLWRYSRHPNYFGEFCVWWGFFLLGVVGGWWALLSPVVMSVLLLKVSGVSLLEQDIGERRPGYREYVETTPAFFPRPRWNASS